MISAPSVDYEWKLAIEDCCSFVALIHLPVLMVPIDDLVRRLSRMALLLVQEGFCQSGCASFCVHLFSRQETHCEKQSCRDGLHLHDNTESCACVRERVQASRGTSQYRKGIAARSCHLVETVSMIEWEP